MPTICLLIFKSSISSNNPVVIVPRPLITNGVTVTFMIRGVFFGSPHKVQILNLSFAFFQLYSVICRESNVLNSASSIFGWLLKYLVVSPRLCVPLLSQNPRGFCVSFSRTDSTLHIYHLFIWSNFCSASSLWPRVGDPFVSQILRCPYIVCLYGQTSVSCTIPGGSPWASSHA